MFLNYTVLIKDNEKKENNKSFIAQNCLWNLYLSLKSPYHTDVIQNLKKKKILRWVFVSTSNYFVYIKCVEDGSIAYEVSENSVLLHLQI